MEQHRRQLEKFLLVLSIRDGGIAGCREQEGLQDFRIQPAI